ncbi:MAG: McrB family protein, partial [Bryobacteraceae bacterium]
MKADGLQALVELIHTPGTTNWRQRAEAVSRDLLGAAKGRYPEAAAREVKLRSPEITEGVSYAAWIHHSNPDPGAYGGLSFVVFPAGTAPALIGLVVGTA